jgi:hypothetical protein
VLWGDGVLVARWGAGLPWPSRQGEAEAGRAG